MARGRLVIPEGADAKLLRKMYRDAQAIRLAYYKKQHQRFARGCEINMEAGRLLAESQGIKPQRETKEIKARRLALRNKIHRMGRKPRPLRGFRGHNPLQFPPFNAGQGIANGGSGVVEWDPWGPDSVQGKTGGRLAVWQSSRPSSGSAYAATDVGFWYYSATFGTLFVTLYTYVIGYGYLYAPYQATYASAYASAVVQVNGPSGILSNSPTEVYWKGVGGPNSDYSDPSGYYFAQTAAPVAANTWYLILGGTVQDVWAGPDADAQVDAYTHINFFGFYQE